MQHEILPPEKRMTGLGECRVEPQDNSIVLFPSRCVHRGYAAGARPPPTSAPDTAAAGCCWATRKRLGAPASLRGCKMSEACKVNRHNARAHQPGPAEPGRKQHSSANWPRIRTTHGPCARLGDLQRRRGEFGAALKTYRVLQHLRCDAMTNWLVAVASGERLPWPAPEGVQPSPFIRIKNFLNAAQQERLLTMTYAEPQDIYSSQYLLR